METMKLRSHATRSAYRSKAMILISTCT